MNRALTNIPLFPLSGHVLPGGVMRLRIFEPRYLRMVREVCAQGDDGRVGMCMFNDNGSVEHNTHIHSVATLARVIDFEHRDDGLLGITVEGVEPCEITTIRVDSDGLRRGDVTIREPWQETPLPASYTERLDRPGESRFATSTQPACTEIITSIRICRCGRRWVSHGVRRW